VPHERQSEPELEQRLGAPEHQPSGGLASIFASLGWVLLGVASLLTGAVAVIAIMAMAHQATPERSPALLMGLAIGLTFVLPFALVSWKHWGDPTRIRTTMAWFPMVWSLSGLVIGTQLIPDLVGSALRNADRIVEGQFGQDSTFTRAMSSAGHQAADVINPGGEELIAPRGVETSVDLDHALTLPIQRERNAIFVDVSLHGSNGNSVDRKYLFDTGASFTTITSETAAELGIEVPDNAPTVEFNTASGLRVSRVVYLPALSIGGIEVPSLLVSVCDPCATDLAAGLLGLNVMREFVVQMDYQAHNIRLLPRVHEGEPDRAYDIRQVVNSRIRGRADIMLERVRWPVEIENRGQVALRDVMPLVEFTDGPTLYGAPIERIEPGEKAVSLVSGPVGEGSTNTEQRREFTIRIAEAKW
jgi:clan AA aspartic protease (TIGR02281 family)